MQFCLEHKLNWLYIDINSYFATIEQQLAPELRNKPVVIVPMQADSTCAIAASYEAKRHGVSTGTKIYKAKELCPDLICMQARHKVYIEYHHKIFQEIDKYLHVDHIFSIDEGACKLTGSYCNSDKAQAIAQQIKEAIQKNVGDYITCSIGIAPNRYLAKIASNMRKPDGLTVINPSDLPHKLYNLKLSDLPGVGSKTQTRLQQNKINSVRQLLSLDQSHIKALWGNIWGEKVWYLLRGKDLPLEAAKSHVMSHSQVLAPDKMTSEKAKIIFTNLVLKLAARLRSKSLYTNSVYVEIQTSYGNSVFKRAKIHTSCDNQTLLQVAQSSWDNLINQNYITKCKKITISFYKLQQESKQLQLADINQQKQRTLLSKTIDSLNQKYEKDLVRIGILPDALTNKPVIAFSHVPTDSN